MTNGNEESEVQTHGGSRLAFWSVLCFLMINCTLVPACTTVSSGPAESTPMETRTVVPARSVEASPPPSDKPGVPNVSVDPTATHLHDMAGVLLLFIVEHQSLPAKLEDLGDLSEGKEPHPADLDPVTHRAFTYLPDGSKPKGLQGRLIIYQSLPTLRGGKWALLLDDSAGDGKPVTYVQFIPNDLLRGFP